MKTNLTINISLADIKESVDRRFHTEGTAEEYLHYIIYLADRSLSHLWDDISKQIIYFAKMQLEAKLEGEK